MTMTLSPSRIIPRTALLPRAGDPAGRLGNLRSFGKILPNREVIELAIHIDRGPGLIERHQEHVE